jgi:hypothetical protein
MKIFSNPSVGDSISKDRPVAKISPQNISVITIYMEVDDCQKRPILFEKLPLIITMKWVRYKQKDTLAKGENIQ